MSGALVLDSWAVLAWLGDEKPAATEVAGMLEAAASRDVTLSMSLINLAEVYYTVARRRGVPEASRLRGALMEMPITFVSVDDDLVWEAAGLKAKHRLAFADCFAAALSFRLGASLVTGDPEFRTLEGGDGLRVNWLSRT
jgi:ribonuclease VapC